ncbi:MAG: biotin--[acetyl-CoA-carboxylase] ligase [Planctomycetota bacterium]|nr:biotin--[acetyl-CoA-carboxylase] ligase [Planctomycetota bacterium]
MEEVNQILERMYDRRGGFCLVEELMRDGGLTREKVEGAMAAIEAKGQALERLPGRGVKLAEPIRMDAHLITRGLSVRRVGRDAVCFGEVGSTNDVARGAGVAGGCDGLVITAEAQTAGRGRHGRAWVSQPGRNVLASVVLEQGTGPLATEAVTIAAGVAIAEGVHQACGAPCRLKWPNDVLLEEGKLAGVLVETFSTARGPWLVVGFGVNVNEAPPAEAVDRPAAALRTHAGAVERIEVLRSVLVRLDAWVRAIEAGQFEALHQAWVSRCGMINQRVTVQSQGRLVTGRVLDVSPLEGLVLACDNGQTVSLHANASTIVG